MLCAEFRCQLGSGFRLSFNHGRAECILFRYLTGHREAAGCRGLHRSLLNLDCASRKGSGVKPIK